MKKIQSKRKNVQSKRKKIIKTVISTIIIIAMVIVIVVTNTTVSNLLNNKMVTNVTKDYSITIDNKKAKTDGVDLQYYKSDFTAQELTDFENSLKYNMVAEGTVLLQNNDDYLPVSKNETFSFFSANAKTRFNPSAISAMSGAKSNNLKDFMEEAGLKVNEELWNFYAQGDGKGYGLGSGSVNYGRDEDFKINEAPLSILENSGVLASVENTIPVYVLSRVAGEGRDMPRSMYNHTDIQEDKVKHYLELDSIEKEIISYLNDNYENFILVLNVNSAIELGWTDEFENLKSIVLAPNLDTLGEVLTGEVNPSGKLVDTFANDALASPAAQNFGSYYYYDETGQMSDYNYISYLEGIYVGYRYYETRYEDVVLSQGNPGEFQYDEEVRYPFGYGLSYTEFEWSNFAIDWNKDIATINVEVTNIGDVEGKEVVQIYAQSPYTDYDKLNKVEKASVELIGFAKTGLLKSGETETVTIEISEEQLKSYDYTGAKTYILSPGTHYITAAHDSHDAINNILSNKGYTSVDGMTYNGREDLVSEYMPKNATEDLLKYSKDTATNMSISNLFDEANGDLLYLSRSDWEGTFPKPDGEISDVISTWGNEINGEIDGLPASFARKKTASNALLDSIKSKDSKNPVEASSISDKPVYGEKNGLDLIDMRGLNFDDPKWEQLLNQLKADDYKKLIGNSGYGSDPLKSVGKSYNVDGDTASGLVYGGTGTMFSKMITLAQTWNKDLAYDYGKAIGNGALQGGANGWYAPSMNIHRTPFSGRNGEYYSEDGYLSGVFAAQTVYGASEKGLYTFVKHFALNDQENHRGDSEGQNGLVTWSNEQAIREIYLKPFEATMKVGDVTLEYVSTTDGETFINKSKQVPANMALMTAFNRIGTTWTGGSYPLITGLLRTEWGFNGFVITDNANTSVFMDTYQMIEAGADAKLLNAEDPTDYIFDENDPATYHYGRKAMHRILYTIANSNAMNGAMSGSVFKQEFNLGVRTTDLARYSITGAASLTIVVLGWFTYRRHRKSKKISS